MNDLRSLRKDKPGAQLSALVQENFTSLPLDGNGRAAGLKNPSHASMAIAKGMEARFVRQFGSLFQAETLRIKY